ncbi:non-specific lipid transfer protein GPI-anchored 10-like [Macadamia integrifolia]|uniref:non-specific lipid transfer protein GPI-anchored 10-like n=1 Tax=Macadamia integrifolia TaxID=60698 RepID=UPI001C52F12A|nr:non-specific lipid transfer protein GPI-anchored 10-like [Macadamia integrifolia]
MGSSGLVLARSTWLSTLLLPCVLLLILPSMVKAQFPGCSTQGLVGLDHLEPCLNYQVKSSTDACCQVLDQMVKDGYNCMCLLLSSTSTTSSLSSAPLSLPFANCYIYVPPLRQCPGNTNVPAPLVLPPNINGSEPMNPPSSMATNFTPPPPPSPPLLDATILTPPPPPPSPQLPLPLPPPLGIQTLMNLTQGKSITTVVEEEPHSNNNGPLNSTVPYNNGGFVKSYMYSGESTKQVKIWNYLWVVWVVVILLQTCIL